MTEPEGQGPLTEGWLRLLLEAAPHVMLVVDRARKITLVTQGAEQFFGYRREELLGRDIELLIRRELFALRKDGGEIPIEMTLTPIETPAGGFTLASIVDISARRHSEDELRRSNEDLQQFAYSAAHDLQEPLRMVASYSELLAQRYRGKLDERADKYIYYAVDGAKRMQGLVADLLTYSRVGSQGQPLAPVSAEAVMKGVVDALAAAIGRADASVQVGPLPTVLADEEQLRQVFQNLLDNALKFRREAPPVVEIGATACSEGWRFFVKDNGIGIGGQHMERIFQMFQRLHERGKYEGSGVGLTIAKRILERHGGRIWLESELQAGSTFFFTLQSVPGQA